MWKPNERSGMKQPCTYGEQEQRIYQLEKEKIFQPKTLKGQCSFGYPLVFTIVIQNWIL